MANRCDGKFAGMSETEIEVKDSEISDDTLHVAVLVQRMCDNCGESAAESEQEAEITIEHECDKEARLPMPQTEHDSHDARAPQEFTLAAALQSRTLMGLLKAIMRANVLFVQGEYEAAEDALKAPPISEGLYDRASFDDWMRRFRQECRERKSPTYDIPALVLARITEHCQREKYGFDPGSLRGAKDGDERWRATVAEEALNELVNAGTLLYRQKLVWLPETWEAHRQSLSLRAKRNRTTPAPAQRIRVSRWS